MKKMLEGLSTIVVISNDAQAANIFLLHLTKSLARLYPYLFEFQKGEGYITESGLRGLIPVGIHLVINTISFGPEEVDQLLSLILSTCKDREQSEAVLCTINGIHYYVRLEEDT
jgi:hypothetical protein